MHKSKLTTSGMLNVRRMLSGLYGHTAPLAPLHLTQSLDIDKFLALLNRRDPPRLPPQKPGDIPRMSYTPPPSTPEVLRGWIDEWLDSGKGKDGVEDPRDRRFKQTEGVALAAYEFSERGKIRLLTGSDGLAPWISTYEGEPTGALRPLLGPRNEDYAREQLVFFLLSDLRFKLAKCRKENCGTYYLLKHWNRQYKRGTLCDFCKRSRSEESAIKATAEVRDHAKTQLHDFAAKKFAKQILSTPDWHRQKALKNAISKFLSAKIERSESLRTVYKSGVTGKWVSRSENWNAIDTAAKGEK